MPTAEFQELQAVAKKNGEQLETLTKNIGGLVDRLGNTRLPGHPDPRSTLGGFAIRNGEDPMSSRGFSFLKCLGLMSGALDPDQCKVEIDLHNRMSKSFDAGSSNGYTYGGAMSVRGHRLLAPIASNFFSDLHTDRNFRNEMKQLVVAGTDGADMDQIMGYRVKSLMDQGMTKTKALSWLNELSGGAIVAPPEMGELIELLRNKEALVNAGARVVPLPPQGRLKYPRQTAASNTFWVGENSPIAESIIGTGEVTLQAKKLAVLIKAPNELIRFASPAAEALLRDDMTKSLALGLDLAGLEGNGTDTRPRGLINFPNITKITSSDPRSNGDALVGQDVYRMIAAVEEANAEYESFVMRPKTLYKFYQLRADAVAQGDSRGPFLFNLIREAGADTPALLGGYPVVKSTQISQVRTKGNVSTLTYIAGGMFSDLLIGMFGAIEFAATTQGDTSFVNDQTWVRGILSADIQARHEAAFVWMDGIDTTL